jgi:hypothetical protein
MRDLITLDAYRVDLSAEVLERMGVISSVDPKFNGAFDIEHRGREAARHGACCGGWDHASSADHVILTRCTFGIPLLPKHKGLTDTLDRVVAAGERDFRGDIAPGGSL